MDDYVMFIAESIKDVDPEKARRQKQLEERIERPFRLPPPERP